MRNQQHKTINQTFSIPVEISEELHAYVKRREMSRFVAEAIRKELQAKKEELKEAYIAMSQDQEQEIILKEWESTLSDGIENEEW